jgi:hypothetical protein
MRYLNPIGLILVAALVATMWMDRTLDIRVDRVSEPVHPSGTDAGGLVVAEVGFNPSRPGTMTAILAGECPFSTAALNALMKWRFAYSSEGTTSVTFLFRPRSFHKMEAIEPAIASFSSQDSPAIPLRITDPGYRLGMSERGSVILEVALNADGSVADVQTVLGAEPLTELARDEVRGWTFSPAVLGGQPRPSTVFVVISFVNPLD